MRKVSETNIFSIATIATEPVYDELLLLLRSIAIFHPNIPIFILTQSIVKERLLQETGLPTNITFVLRLEKYGNRRWKEMNIPEAIEFLSQKAVVLDYALEHHSNSLFVDSDITIASPLGVVDDSKDLGLSPSHPTKAIVKFGKYNGGWIFVNNKNFPRWWRDQMATGSSPFIEQFCLEGTNKHFSVFHFSPNYNFNPYKRLRTPDDRSKQLFHRLLRVNSDPKKGITYRGKPLISFHYRFNNSNMYWHHFIMVHLYKGSPELFKLINARGDYPFSDKFLVNNETYILAIQIHKKVITTISRKAFFTCIRLNTSFSGMRQFLHRFIQKVIIIAVYPYYLIREGIYFYYVTNRLTNRKLNWQGLIKILGQAYYYFIKTSLLGLFSHLRITNQ